MVRIDSSAEGYLQISWTIVFWSFFFAVVHAILEIIFLRLEADALRQSFMHYSIVCFNARAGWIPFDHLYLPVAKSEDEKQEIINYDMIQSSFHHMDFEFDDDNCQFLINRIAS
jgi:hypothetical protein